MTRCLNPKCRAEFKQSYSFCGWCGAKLDNANIHGRPKRRNVFNPTVLFSNCNLNDVITFGRYPQSHNGKIAPLQWQVLQHDEETTLLTTRNGLDCQPFHNKEGDTDWAHSDIRRWLNEEFWERAFLADEQIFIMDSYLNGGEAGPTYDKVFLLSTEETQHCLRSQQARLMQCSPYAHQNGSKAVNRQRYAWWWLRSPGHFAYTVAFVDYEGHIRACGHPASIRGGTVRPAIRVRNTLKNPIKLTFPE